MSNTLRFVLAALVIFSVASAALAPPPKRSPASTYRWALRWLMPAALAWAGVAHLRHAPTVSRLLLVAFVEVACVEIWLLRRRDDPGRPNLGRLRRRRSDGDASSGDANAGKAAEAP